MKTCPSQLADELARAIHNHEFVLYYQPQFNLASATFDGVEALIRWQHPERGLLLPEEFIDVVENTDLILTIGEWALKTACTQFKSWQERQLSPGRISVNVAGRQFHQPAFVESIIGFLEEIRLSPSCLELELSEKMIIEEDDEKLIQMIHQLSQKGILIALDDFGTGHANQDYLKRIPVDRIKIAKTHIDHILENNHKTEWVKHLIKLSAALRIPIVAEGVESLMQMQSLSGGHMVIQGNYFSEPLPAEQMGMFLAVNKK